MQETCRATVINVVLYLYVGLSDELANDIRVRQALQKVTRLNAVGRIQRYGEFARNLTR